jgi:hypothetical protein
MSRDGNIVSADNGTILRYALALILQRTQYTDSHSVVLHKNRCGVSTRFRAYHTLYLYVKI